MDGGTGDDERRRRPAGAQLDGLAERVAQDHARLGWDHEGAEAGGQAAGDAGAADEDVVDADFEEVKEDDKK